MGVYVCVCGVDMPVGGVCVVWMWMSMCGVCVCVWCGYDCVVSVCGVCVCVHLICSGNRKMMSKMGHDTQYTNTNQFWDI